MRFNNFVLILTYTYSASVVADTVTTTTRTYDLNVPGSSPIRIVEGESLWNPEETTPKPNSRSERRTFTTSTTTTNVKNPIDVEQEENSAEFTHSALRDFLNNYADKITKEKPAISKDDIVTNQEDTEGKEKKSWSMLNLREHNHPYEDKTGWVTMEPLPWSISKISKWQNKPKPVENSWDNYSPNQRPSDNDFEYSNDRLSSWNKPIQQDSHQYDIKPEKNGNKYQVYYVEDKPSARPVFPKPSTLYGQTVHVHATSNNHRNPIKVNNYYKHDENCNHDESVGIITDGKPSNFPSSHFDNNRRTGTELHSETHPFMGDGEWVLLSATKGYRVPKNRQRSLDVSPDSIGSHRSVRLTVLPPLKGSKVNMTTSHGGLLQVDSTLETVEQAQRKFVKLQKLKNRPKRPVKLTKRKQPTREITGSTIATIPRNTGSDSSAVLAAIGAGMIPATMAMLVPIAMNGKRRKKRDILLATSNPSSSVEITLPRYL
ncbi:hypothetical protein NQ314_020464 [Rhamnusium bicolor]|uniref:Uncharacterized protein n=1 Tax=Rhamnusium bicolor TaxID=1586634 RepID=A0AAV8WKZ0_9CUCU|nr:hypothetical protein NQ314_020464 [Rhamnusium bicolor]